MRVEPVNLAALVLQKRLRELYALEVDRWFASDPQAGEIARRIISAVDTADELVNGSAVEPLNRDAEWARIRLSMISPMTPEQAVEYFARELGIEITQKQVRNWRDRGRLYAVDRSRTPHRYRLVDIYTAWLNRHRHGWTARRPSEAMGDTQGKNLG
ncbi:hypothetical protein [Nesterenkonia sp.]|uniref:hypothetical protein n=1 Tax=Nesterenkonia sp. TaxID=704201 RepID=UPI002611B7C0|nr:hypothetical protein [Nesterenkonia sp.]